MFSYKVYGNHNKGGYGIVDFNPKSTYLTLVPKRDNFYVTDGLPMMKLGSIRVMTIMSTALVLTTNCYSIVVFVEYFQAVDPCGLLHYSK